jgi:muramoyltetrapeptide carboxypeptidase
MRFDRRVFLGAGGAAAAGLLARDAPAAPSVLKPPRLRRGDCVALVNTVRNGPDPGDVDAAKRSFEALGLRMTCAPSLHDPARSRELTDRERAREINAFFLDPGVAGLVALRGGYGSAHLLPHLDYQAIRARPKVIMGFSDLTALLVGINARSGLVTFHGPMGITAWPRFTVEQMERVLFRGEAASLPSPASEPEGVRMLVPGRARGRLLGGNLTVLSSIVGSPYLEPRQDLVLFLEEVREPTSEVDRMLTQLEQAGVMARVRGLVFGQFPNCVAPQMDPKLTLDRVLLEHVTPRRIPAWRGAMIGHVDRQLTLPIGLPVEVDATRATIRLLEPAVV